MDSMFIEQKYLLLASSQLSQFKKKGDHLYNFRCPYCGDSQKSKLKARGFVFLKDNKFIYKFHNSSKGASLQNLLKYVDVKIYNDYIFERYKKTDNEPDIGKFTQPKFLKGDSPLRKLKKVSQLSWNHPVKQFVQKRKIPTNLHFELFFARKFYEWVNSIVPNKFQDLSNDHPRLVIPFFDEDNKMFAFQGRAFGKENPKYITIILDPTRDKIYGLNRLDKNNPIFAVEGPIDSLFLDNCVAVAGADFNKLPLDYTIIFDNERRNKEVLKQIEKTITKGYKVVLWPDDIKEKDINEMILSGMTKEDVKRIITKNTYQGNMALIKLTTWRKVDAE